MKTYSSLTLDDCKSSIKTIFGEHRNISHTFDLQLQVDSTRHISISSVRRMVDTINEKIQHPPKKFFKDGEKELYKKFITYLEPYTQGLSSDDAA